MLALAIANDIINKLKRYNIKCYINNVAKTGSIYLKIDNFKWSIRIGNHNGREKYKYKYNIRFDIKTGYSEIDNGIERYYYAPNQINMLINSIIDNV